MLRAQQRAARRARREAAERQARALTLALSPNPNPSPNPNSNPNPNQVDRCGKINYKDFNRLIRKAHHVSLPLTLPRPYP